MNRILKTLLVSMIVLSSGYALVGVTFPYFSDTEMSAENTVTAGTWGSPPDVSGAYPNTSCLWEPNHWSEFFDISIEGVFDPDGGVVTITITNITSDESTTGEGSGGDIHAPDAYGIGTDTAALRAERSGTGNGRVYRINFTASDGVDEDALGNVTVCVPHGQSAGCNCTDDGQIYDATV